MKISAHLLWLVAIVPILLTGCGGGSGTGFGIIKQNYSTTAAISGFLYEDTASSRTTGATAYVPIKDAKVTCDSQYDYSDANGYFKVTGLTPGEKTCYVSKTGYRTYSFTKTAVAGASVKTGVILMTEGENLTITASVSPTSGTTSDTFTLTCTVSGGTASTLEGRCDSTENWSIMSGTTKTCTYSSTGSYTPGCRADSYYTDDVDSAVTVTSGTGVSVTASVSPTSGTTSDTFTLTCNVTGTETTLEGRCDTTEEWSPITSGYTKSCTYASTGSYTPGCRVDGTTSDNVDSPVSVTAPTTDITVSSFAPSSGASDVPYNGATFSVIFSGSLDNSIDFNNQTTLDNSGFTLSISRSGGGSTIIDNTNALDYGSFSYNTTNVTNDTITFTLDDNTTLSNNGMFYLKPGETYNINSYTAPSNLQGASGETVDTSGAPSSGSFTTSSDVTSPQVSSFSPADGATGVQNNAPTFSVIFNESMDTSVNLNNQTTLDSSGFTLDISRSGGGSTTIDNTNALDYGIFSYNSSNFPNDTLSFTLYTNTTLDGNGLYTIKASSTYNITGRTVPTNLKDLAGNLVDTSTNIPSTGNFTTAAE